MSLTDADYVALTLFGEARGEPTEGRIAVACVLRNRLRIGRWGHSYEAVCVAPWQFSCWRVEGGEANYRTLQKVKAQVDAGGFVDDPIYQESRWIVEGLTSGRLMDRVKHATHYFVSTLTPLPAWALHRLPVCRVGNHLFFADVN